MLRSVLECLSRAHNRRTAWSSKSPSSILGLLGRNDQSNGFVSFDWFDELLFTFNFFLCKISLLLNSLLTPKAFKLCLEHLLWYHRNSWVLIERRWVLRPRSLRAARFAIWVFLLLAELNPCKLTARRFLRLKVYPLYRARGTLDLPNAIPPASKLISCWFWLAKVSLLWLAARNLQRLPRNLCAST